MRLNIDARTLQSQESLCRGIGQFTYHHLLAVRDLRPAWEMILHVDPGEVPPELTALAQAGPGGIAPVEDFDPASARVVHIPDPLNIHPGFDSPFRLFRGSGMTMTFYDLTSLDHYLPAWPQGQRNAYRNRLLQAVSSNAHFFAISGFTRRECTKRLGVPAERVTTVSCGLNRSRRTSPPDERERAAVLEALGVRRPFLLHVGALDPHKNFEGVLQAFLGLRAGPDVSLVVVGAMEGWAAAHARRISEQGAEGVVFTGFVSREVLECLYASAHGLLCLSRSEGFGLPVLEAMSAGCPVIGSACGAIPEVVGTAGLLFSPEDHVGIARALRRLLTDDAWRAELAAAGRMRALLFTWREVAKRSVGIWKRWSTPA